MSIDALDNPAPVSGAVRPKSGDARPAPSKPRDLIPYPANIEPHSAEGRKFSRLYRGLRAECPLDASLHSVRARLIALTHICLDLERGDLTLQDRNRLVQNQERLMTRLNLNKKLWRPR